MANIIARGATAYHVAKKKWVRYEEASEFLSILEAYGAARNAGLEEGTFDILRVPESHNWNTRMQLSRRLSG